jgi:hypothetical protein
VGHTLLLQGLAQGTGHMFLASDIGEALGTVFAGEYLVSHGRNSEGAWVSTASEL